MWQFKWTVSGWIVSCVTIYCSGQLDWLDIGQQKAKYALSANIETFLLWKFWSYIKIISKRRFILALWQELLRPSRLVEIDDHFWTGLAQRFKDVCCSGQITKWFYRHDPHMTIFKKFYVSWFVSEHGGNVRCFSIKCMYYLW